jgi:hypothetical protein
VIMRLFVLGILILVIQSCKDSSCDWKGGEITDVGTYCNTDVLIKVYKEGNYLRYEVKNKKDSILIKSDENISVIQQWGLFFDSDRNLWVFSSDIGDSIWKRDSITGKYNKKIFIGWLKKDSVPSEIFLSSMKRFLK